jgi:hypothetical protein
MPFDSPPETEFTAACEIVTAYIRAPESGWSPARAAAIRRQIGEWSFALTDSERHAAHDAEKS